MLTRILVFTILALLSPILTNSSAVFCRTPQYISLPAVVRRTMQIYFSSPEFSKKSLLVQLSEYSVAPEYRQAYGVFVTLSLSGKSRACWGSVYPDQPDLVKAAAFATLGALTKDYRYPPIRRQEWEQLKVQVTIIRSIQPINNLSKQNPLLDGLLVRSGGKSGVLLPGEAKDAHYQLMKCKLKAGIKPGESFQLYSLKASIYD